MRELTQFRERLRKAWAIYGKRPLQLSHIHRTVEHLHGPLSVPYEADELIVLCLLRDSELYVNSFVRHYTRLGARHIFFMDNGSTDRTIDQIRQYDNVTALRCALPFATHKMALRHYLIRRFAQSDRWALYVDVDEFFDYPFSDRVGLAAFLGYLRQRGYTAVLAHMLDMFPDAPLHSITSQIEDDLPALHCYYDITDLARADYYFPGNILSSTELKVYHGGVRRFRLSGGELGVLLSKHPLFLLDGRTRPLHAHEHSLRGGVIADVTAVLYHYKFLQNFIERARRAVQERNYHNQSAEYREYLLALEREPDLNLRQPTARQLSSVQDLVENQFLYVSPDYQQWAASRLAPGERDDD